MMLKREIETLCFSRRSSRQMRFIAGPRQAGKTTILKRFLRSLRDPYFFHSRAPADRRIRYN